MTALGYKALILDIDGTLWDSTGVVAEAWNAAIIERLGVDPGYTGPSIKCEFGKTMTEIADSIFPPIVGQDEYLKNRDRYMKVFEYCFHKEHEYLALKESLVYPGVRETIISLSETIPLYIVSNCQHGYIENFLRKTGLEERISGYMCFEDTFLDKGCTIMQLMEKYQIRDAAYVGDIEKDADASIKAGIPFIWASYGFGNVPLEKCAHVIKNFSELG